MRTYELDDNPVIASYLKTGYPPNMNLNYYQCERCGDELNFDEVYFDNEHEWLCKYCLLSLHKKEY